MSPKHTPDLWEERACEEDASGPSRRAMDIAEALFDGGHGGHMLILNHMEHGVLICNGRESVENVRWPLCREIARAVDSARREALAGLDPAAVPEMVAALEELLRCAPDTIVNRRWKVAIEAARAALQKARMEP